MRAIIYLVVFVISIICYNRRIPGDSYHPHIHPQSREFVDLFARILNSAQGYRFYSILICHVRERGEGRRRRIQLLYFEFYLSTCLLAYLPIRVGKVRGHKTALLPSCKARSFNLISAYTRCSVDVSSCNLPGRSDLPTRSRDRFNRDEYETIMLQKLITDMENLRILSFLDDNRIDP